MSDWGDDSQYSQSTSSFFPVQLKRKNQDDNDESMASMASQGDNVQATGLRQLDLLSIDNDDAVSISSVTVEDSFQQHPVRDAFLALFEKQCQLDTSVPGPNTASVDGACARPIDVIRMMGAFDVRETITSEMIYKAIAEMEVWVREAKRSDTWVNASGTLARFVAHVESNQKAMRYWSQSRAAHDSIAGALLPNPPKRSRLCVTIANGEMWKDQVSSNDMRSSSSSSSSNPNTERTLMEQINNPQGNNNYKADLTKQDERFMEYTIGVVIPWLMERHVMQDPSSGLFYRPVLMNVASGDQPNERIVSRALKCIGNGAALIRSLHHLNANLDIFTALLKSFSSVQHCTQYFSKTIGMLPPCRIAPFIHAFPGGLIDARTLRCAIHEHPISCAHLCDELLHACKFHRISEGTWNTITRILHNMSLRFDQINGLFPQGMKKVLPSSDQLNQQFMQAGESYSDIQQTKTTILPWEQEDDCDDDDDLGQLDMAPPLSFRDKNSSLQQMSYVNDTIGMLRDHVKKFVYPKTPLQIPALEVLKYQAFNAQGPGFTDDDRFEGLIFQLGMIGRCLFPINLLDNWDSFVFLKGEAGTGKSLVLNTISKFFESSHVVQLSANLQEQFSLAAHVHKYVTLIPDARGLSISPSDYLSMVTGETQTYGVKHGDDVMDAWQSAIFLATNAHFPYEDKTGEMARRTFTILFETKVLQKDTNMCKQEAIEPTAPVFMIICLLAYHYVRIKAEFAGTGVQGILPKMCKHHKNVVYTETQPFLKYIRARCEEGTILKGKKCHFEENDLRKDYLAYLNKHAHRDVDLTSGLWRDIVNEQFPRLGLVQVLDTGQYMGLELRGELNAVPSNERVSYLTV